MTRQPSRQIDDQLGLAEALEALSAREQIGLLVRATRPLSGRDRVEVWRVAGFSVLRDRFLPVLLHILLKRLLAGALWWVLCGVAVIAILLVLVVVQQINPNAVAPVLAVTISFFAGFLLFTLIDFLRSLVQFFRTTCARGMREELLASLNARAYPERLALLRLTSASLARKIPGESLLTSLVTGALFLLAEALLIVLAVILSSVLPALGSFPWLWLVAGVAFVAGLFGPGGLQQRLRARKTA